jgi:hypothetical protein
MPAKSILESLPLAAPTNPRLGRDFEDFLKEQNTLEASTAYAMKRVLDWEQLAEQSVIGEERSGGRCI